MIRKNYKNRYKKRRHWVMNGVREKRRRQGQARLMQIPDESKGCWEEMTDEEEEKLKELRAKVEGLNTVDVEDLEIEIDVDEIIEELEEKAESDAGDGVERNEGPRVGFICDNCEKQWPTKNLNEVDGDELCPECVS